MSEEILVTETPNFDYKESIEDLKKVNVDVAAILQEEQEKQDLQNTVSFSDFKEIASKITPGRIGEVRDHIFNESILLGKVIETQENATISKKYKDEAVILVSTVDNLPVYVRQKDAGLNQPSDISLMHGNPIAVVIETLIYLEDDKDENYVIALGSVQHAQFVLTKRLAREMQSNPKKFIQQRRTGFVEYIVDQKYAQYVSIYYQGLSIHIEKVDFAYSSRAHPFNENLNPGDVVDFCITGIDFKDYSRNSSSFNYPTAKPIRGKKPIISGNAKVFKPNPDVIALQSYVPGKTVNGRIIKYGDTAGVLVEILPGWVIKLKIPKGFKNPPTALDAAMMTEVSCQIESLTKGDDGRNYGYARLINFIGKRQTQPDFNSKG